MFGTQTEKSLVFACDFNRLFVNFFYSLYQVKCTNLQDQVVDMKIKCCVLQVKLDLVVLFNYVINYCVTYLIMYVGERVHVELNDVVHASKGRSLSMLYQIDKCQRQHHLFHVERMIQITSMTEVTQDNTFTQT